MENEKDNVQEENVKDKKFLKIIRWMTEGTNPNHIPRSDCG
jgi:hypothetical protein